MIDVDAVTAVQVQIKTNQPLPAYQTPGSAGMDLHAAADDVIYNNETVSFGTGLRVAVPPGYELQIRSRSGMAAKGIVVANAPGTIDSDYRGEIRVLLRNCNSGDDKFAFVVNIGDRIAQAVLCPVARCQWVPVEELDDTERGEGGFGSTGE